MNSSRRRPVRPRGVALLATVLLCATAAAIAIALLAQSTSGDRAETRRRSMETAERLVVEARAELEARLAEDPGFLLTRVGPLERARVCAPLDDLVVQPGQDWPAACGASWDYTDPENPGEVAVELEPPGVAHPELVVRLAATAGGTTYGLSSTYRLADAGRFTLWSQADLDLAVASRGTPGALVGGAWSAGTVSFSPDVSLDGATVATETGFATAPTDISGRYFGPVPAPGAPPVAAVRDLLARPATAAEVVAGTALAQRAACPEGTPSLRIHDGLTYSSAVCLRAGGTVRLVDDTLVTLPERAGAWLVLVGASGANTADVFVMADAPSADVPCAPGCDLLAAAAVDLAAGTHPGALPAWQRTALPAALDGATAVPAGYVSTKVGTVPLPRSGILAADADTHIGLCGPAFATGGPCDTVSGTGPGMDVPVPLTVLAGSPLRPADIWIDGPVSSTNSFGVLATGAVRVPYWARPANSSLTLSLAAVSANRAGDPDGALVPVPASVPPRTGPTDPNWATALVLDGSLGGARITPLVAGYDSAQVTSSPAVARSAPWLPGPGWGFARSTSTRLSAETADALLSR